MEFFPGQVFKLYCATCADKKDKFFVVALTEPVLRCFLINSDMTKLQQSRDDLALECVPLAQSQHPFLTYDSYLGCNYLFPEYTAKSLNIVLNARPGAYVGNLHQDAMEEAYRRFDQNVSLPKKRIDDLKKCWIPLLEKEPA